MSVFVNLTAIVLFLIKIKGETQLLILQPYGTEREKEHCFKNKCWLGEDVCDKVWTCDLESLNLCCPL